MFSLSVVFLSLFSRLCSQCFTMFQHLFQFFVIISEKFCIFHFVQLFFVMFLLYVFTFSTPIFFLFTFFGSYFCFLFFFSFFHIVCIHIVHRWCGAVHAWCQTVDEDRTAVQAWIQLHLCNQAAFTLPCCGNGTWPKRTCPLLLWPTPTNLARPPSPDSCFVHFW